MGRTESRVEVLGVPVDLVNREAALRLVGQWLTSGERGHTILAVNAEKIMAARGDPDLRRVLSETSLVIADGMGPIVSLALFGHGWHQRVAGVDLAVDLLRLAAKREWQVFLFGGEPGVGEAAAAAACRQAPGLQIVGVCHGFLNSSDSEELPKVINASGARILLVGLGSPRQERWISAHREKLKVGVAMGVGGTFDILSGRVRRAPPLVQKLCMEWIYRFLHQPWRFRRYATVVLFMGLVLRRRLGGGGDSQRIQG